MRMMLFLDAIDSDGEQREFGCNIESLEEGFNFVNLVVSEQATLLNVYILDKNGRTDLPVAAFDGIAVDIAFARLQKEWELVLTNSLPAADTHNQQVLSLVSRQQIICGQRVAFLEKMIVRYHSWMQRTQEGCSIDERRAKLLDAYQTQIERHQDQLQVARFQSASLTKRLNQLMGHSS